jgi:alpha-methylacyl-CoA racemase
MSSRTPHPPMNETMSRDPLSGLRVIEFTSIGPGPHCAMLLSDMGAEVLRIDRPGGNGWPNPIVDRGRHTIELNIRDEAGRVAALNAVGNADVVIEGNRPGVMQRLGLGPDELLACNARLIYARMTGWGQCGPLARTAGHDINYIALAGALEAITGTDGHRIPPLNLVGDFGGGSLYLALGIVATLYERQRSGRGQVIDAAIVDGVASMMTMFAGLLPAGYISFDPEGNLLGGRAPFYRCYECADGKYISIGAIEPQFYTTLLGKIAAPEAYRHCQNDADTWRERKIGLADIFKAKSRDEWCTILEGSDTCFAPILTYAESITNAHLQARGTYIDIDGLLQAAPAPRFSRTPGRVAPSGDGAALLERWSRTRSD